MVYTGWVLSTKDQISSEMKILTKIYQQNLDCWTESIETGISEHGTFSPDSIENKVVITIMKGGFYLQ